MSVTLTVTPSLPYNTNSKIMELRFQWKQSLIKMQGKMRTIDSGSLALLRTALFLLLENLVKCLFMNNFEPIKYPLEAT